MQSVPPRFILIKIFQTYYYGPAWNVDPNLRERFRSNPFFDDCVKFCQDYDQTAFDPHYDSMDVKEYVFKQTTTYTVHYFGYFYTDFTHLYWKYSQGNPTAKWTIWMILARQRRKFVIKSLVGKRKCCKILIFVS